MLSVACASWVAVMEDETPCEPGMEPVVSSFFWVAQPESRAAITMTEMPDAIRVEKNCLAIANVPMP